MSKVLNNEVSSAVLSMTEGTMKNELNETMSRKLSLFLVVD